MLFRSQKSNKYRDVRVNIKRDNPDFEVSQITLVMDGLGGYSKHLIENINKLIEDKKIANNIINRMQKAVLSESSRIARRFKELSV